MKLHPDGTVEGTPQEIAEYKQANENIQAKRFLKKLEIDRLLGRAKEPESIRQQREYGHVYRGDTMPEVHYRGGYTVSGPINPMLNTI